MGKLDIQFLILNTDMDKAPLKLNTQQYFRGKTDFVVLGVGNDSLLTIMRSIQDYEI